MKTNFLYIKGTKYKNKIKQTKIEDNNYELSII